MARAWKDAIPVGTVDGPFGADEVTKDRALQWVQNLKAIRAAGNKIPVPWISAKPGCRTDECQYVRARFNAGHVEDARFDDKRGMIQLLIDVPGARLDTAGNLRHEMTLPGNRKVDIEIGEIENVGLGDWQDGQGKYWRDVITHAGIKPVRKADEAGFKTLLSTFVEVKTMPTITTKSPGSTDVTWQISGAQSKACSKAPARSAIGLSTTDRIKQALMTDRNQGQFSERMARLNRLLHAGLPGNSMMTLAKGIRDARGSVCLSAYDNPAPVDEMLDLAERTLNLPRSKRLSTYSQALAARNNMGILEPWQLPTAPAMPDDAMEKILARNGLAAPKKQKPAAAARSSRISTPAKKTSASLATTSVPASAKTRTQLDADTEAFCRRNGLRN